ncbi:MAG: putative sterol carrier protein [Oceanospirillaceae bacterium]|jgi:putative sterol carrier protein
MLDLEKLFEKIQQRFNASAAQDISATFQYDLSQEQSFSCEIKDGQCILNQGVHPSADITLALSGELLLGIVSGEADALQAFMEGSIMAQGDLSLAPILVSLFAPNQ